MKNKLFPKIEALINSLDVESISDERKTALQPLVDYIKTKVTTNEEVRLNFICTHNSRRSHLAQVWANVMATYFDIPKINVYSAGTEKTAMFPFVCETLKEQGLEITMLSKEDNPIYAIKFGENTLPIIGFSKTLNHPFNPISGFAAIMTCSQADEGCPFIAGAEKRIPITYNDPKFFDETPLQAEKYTERSLQVATELFYIFSKIN